MGSLGRALQTWGVLRCAVITYLQEIVNPRHIGEAQLRPRHMEKPQIYWWEKVNLVDHKGQKALQIGSRRRRWFQMYKVHHWGREQWHPEFMEYKERRPPYVPKAFRKEDFMKKKGLGRRYSRYNPKLSVPLEEHAAVYKLPKTKYEKPETEPGFFSH